MGFMFCFIGFGLIFIPYLPPLHPALAHNEKTREDVPIKVALFRTNYRKCKRTLEGKNGFVVIATKKSFKKLGIAGNVIVTLLEKVKMRQ